MENTENEIPEKDDSLPRKLKDEDAKRFEWWVNCLQGIHPRVKVVSWMDDGFNLEDYFKKLTGSLDNEVKLFGLKGVLTIPRDRIALIVYFDSSIDSSKSEYLVENSIVLCFGERSWVSRCGASSVEAHHPKKNAAIQLYSYVPVMHKWGYSVKEFIRYLQIFLQKNSIPALPKKKPELLE